MSVWNFVIVTDVFDIWIIGLFVLVAIGADSYGKKRQAKHPYTHPQSRRRI